MNIAIKLTEKSIEEAIKKLEAYSASLTTKAETLVRRLQEAGESVALSSIQESPIGNQITLKSEISTLGDDVVAAITATGPIKTADGHEPFSIVLAVEFGAGIYYNKGNTNPKAKSLGYGVGTFPGQIHAFEDGWYYQSSDGEWHYTHGVKATMPMYKATEEMLNKCVEIAREVFGDG